mmetsp:Transcript_24275/g.44570  ORF Transcript_24275/g.44570 Transcript_24275/m.44570 type:complete len:259 (-) Transcript_24275:74-850(-)
MSLDPLEVYGRYVQRQQHEDQFSEDVRKVIHSGAGSSGRAAAGQRASSPGLRAGAALALGGGQTAAEVHADARAARAQAVDYARRRECPFDDHSAFQAGGSLPPKNPSREPTDAWASAGQASRVSGRYIRDIQQKIGAGAPFDASENATWESSNARRVGSNVEAYADSKAEAKFNKNRMQGTKGLISGDYPQARQGGSNLPPRPGALLPEAQLKVVAGGVPLSSLAAGQVEYLNSRVQMEANRVRNEGSLKGAFAPPV